MFGICVGGAMVLVGVASLMHHRRCCHRLALACAMRRVGATADQRARIRELYERTHAKACGLRGKHEALRDQLADALSQESPEPARLERLEASLFEAVSELSQVMREAVLQLHQILDSNQRAKVSQWLRHHPICHTHCG